MALEGAAGGMGDALWHAQRWLLKGNMFLQVLYGLTLIIISLLGALKWRDKRAKTGWWLVFASAVVELLAMWHVRVLVNRGAQRLGLVAVEHLVAIILLIVGLGTLAFLRPAEPAAPRPSA